MGNNKPRKSDQKFSADYRGQWRVYYFVGEREIASMPASWTDAGPSDPFVELAKGRSLARIEDLLALVQITRKECK
jgi:hypothetical protein